MLTHSARALHELAFMQTNTDSERPACFKIMPTMFAVRLTPTLLRTRDDFSSRELGHDLLFTMSDNTPVSSTMRQANSVFADEMNPGGSTPKLGGARRDRTDDLLLAKQALSQLSYGPGPWQ